MKFNLIKLLPFFYVLFLMSYMNLSYHNPKPCFINLKERINKEWKTEGCAQQNCKHGMKIKLSGISIVSICELAFHLDSVLVSHQALRLSTIILFQASGSRHLHSSVTFLQPSHLFSSRKRLWTYLKY